MAESADIIARDAQNAARLSPDVGREKVGEIYARALLGAAEHAGQTVAVLDELDAIVSEVFAQFPKLETVLGSLLVSHEEKAVVLDRVFAAQISRLLLNFLKVVVAARPPRLPAGDPAPGPKTVRGDAGQRPRPRDHGHRGRSAADRADRRRAWARRWASGRSWRPSSIRR